MDCETLNKVYEIIRDRAEGKPEGSYTVKVLERGKGYVAQKVGEEATETVVAFLSEGKERVISESADLLYHLLVLWYMEDIKPEEVMVELQARMKK